MSFQTELEKSVLQADEKLNREELLTDIFKTFVAKMFEHVLSRGKLTETRLRMDQVVAIKQNLINEFRLASLEQHQKPVEWYESLFETTVKEIYQSAQHKGEDVTHRASQNFEINIDAYKNEGGIFIPK